ncbi:hypothetical protein F3Y22_tig00112206pilonHSYRG00077 [Hibiscus syriacus]|uniref:AB hydrolase-1 domain-containing protein n=1 Tax=Hibiscus syriacus TaxID=106335 RepID=A0A6A2YD81_HIBSY|nr:hypothetical protein F3Y22_tig00112206pilonHSYRG00077 [Hibiscus syriacus]
MSLVKMYKLFLHWLVKLVGLSPRKFQVFAFAGDYSVYLPDLVFFGDSVSDRTESSPAFQAECMAKALRKLGVDKCTVVGLSYGGIVSFKMAELYPELVEYLVVSGSVTAVTQSFGDAGLERLGVSNWGELLLPDFGRGS